MKRRIKLSESTLHRIIKESVRRILTEQNDLNDLYDRYCKSCPKYNETPMDFSTFARAMYRVSNERDRIMNMIGL